MKEAGRIALPNSPDHIVYTLENKPVVPLEHTLVFPDKKEFAISWRNNFARMEQIAELVRKAEIVQEEGTYNVPLDNPKIPYCMGLVLSDLHIGSYNTDYPLIKSLIDTVRETPNSFLIDDGDTFDNGIFMGLQFEQILSPGMQAFTAEDLMREVGDKWAATTLGNHTEWLFNAAGQKPEQIFAKGIKGPIFAGMGLLHLNAGKQKYDIAMAHNYWGKSKINIFNTCVRLRENEYPRADMYVVGHEHIWGHMKEASDGREVLYIRPGTAKTQDRYARVHGIAKRGQKCGIAVIFGTEDRTFEAHPVADAVELMQLRKTISEL